MSKTPKTPKGDGNSPSINGEVIRRNNGVKATNGTVIERSETLIVHKILRIL
ncbi:MAG TPA: hypothetical protein VK426_00915 [Methanobacterium sp.]|nr:hypothetical protein [Methanobacterium sp.]